MEHSLHLGARHFVRGVAPTLSSKILKKVQHGVQNAHDSGTCDLDQLDAELMDAEDGDEWQMIKTVQLSLMLLIVSGRHLHW